MKETLQMFEAMKEYDFLDKSSHFFFLHPILYIWRKLKGVKYLLFGLLYT